MKIFFNILKKKIQFIHFTYTILTSPYLSKLEKKVSHLINNGVYFLKCRIHLPTTIYSESRHLGFSSGMYLLTSGMILMQEAWGPHLEKFCFSALICKHNCTPDSHGEILKLLKFEFTYRCSYLSRLEYGLGTGVLNSPQMILTVSQGWDPDFYRMLLESVFFSSKLNMTAFQWYLIVCRTYN